MGIGKIVKSMFHILAPNSVKLFLLRRKGTIGRNAVIESGAWIFSAGFQIGDNFHLGKNSRIVTSKLQVGDNVHIAENVEIQAVVGVEIGNDSLINKNTTIGGSQSYKSTLFIGDSVHIYQDCYLNTTYPLRIESGAGIGGGTYIFTHGSWQNAWEGFPFGFGAVTIKEDAWLPWRVFVMPGVTIGKEATIGSNALVGKDVPDRSFAVGIPAKVIKQGNEYIKELNEGDKLTLMQQVLERVAGNLRFFQKADVSVVASGTGLVLKSNTGRSIHYGSEGSGTIEEICIGEFTDFPAGVNVFDLRNKRCRYQDHPVAEELRNTLTAYGIRFKRVS